MTKDERDELLEDANQIAYTAIKFSGLYKELTSAEWEHTANLLAKGIVAYLEEQIDETLATIEAAKGFTNAT